MNYGKQSTRRREAEIDSKPKKIKNKVKLSFGKLFLISILVVGIIGICAGFGVMKGIIDSAPDISSIDVVPTGYSTTVLSSDGEEIATLVASGANRKYVTIDEIPVHMQHAFVAIEDSRFYEHNGIDVKGIARAFVVGLKQGGFSQGASTITQQLIKNNVLTTWTSESSFIESLQRKIQEQYLAIELEKQVQNKDWILENYLNTINLGANTLGVQAASNKYFGKDVSELTLSESAVIAGITQNPYKYNPITHPEYNAERRLKVLNNMKEQGYISQEEYDEAVADDVYSRIAEHNSQEETSVNSYFVDALIDDVYDDLIELGYTETEAYKAIYQGGLTIYSTQDMEIQEICDNAVNNLDNYPTKPKYSFTMSFQIKHSDGTTKNYSNQTMLSYYKKKTKDENFTINYNSEEECYEAIEQYQAELLEEGATLVEGSEAIYITLQPQVALTFMDQSTGEVKAIVGGRGEKIGNRTWNRATDTTRQPGSTFKIIAAYAPALDTGALTLASVQDDAPFTVGTKSYKNSDNKFRGLTTIRDAITDSINIVALKTIQQIGVSTGYEYAESFGFTTLTETDKNLGLALGGLSNGVTNLELTAAYATIANQGEYIEPSFYTKVLDHDGNVLLDNSNQETHTVLKESTAWLLTSAMKDVMTQGTGKRAYFGSSMAQAGKTGTTTSNRDSLFAGFTPYYTCVIWGGHDDNSPQSSGTTTYARNIWKEIMSTIHQDLPYKDFEKPSGITSAQVCMKSGLLPETGLCDADPRGSMVYTEYFSKGTVPDTSCDMHIKVTICSESGLIANEFCPVEQVTEAVFILGGTEEGTTESAYVLPASMINQICTLHNESTIVIPEESTDPNGTDIPSSENTGTTDVPDNQQPSEGSTGTTGDNTGTTGTTGTTGSDTGTTGDNTGTTDTTGTTTDNTSGAGNGSTTP
ncbi:MAG: PBP1A family penicillin-binding protein [Agathobacter sp.]|nr:PBP1A family penicillin-binding protein [Agathobacter sp.]